MDSERGNEIWRSENRDLRLEKFIEKFANELENVPKTRKDEFCEKKLRNLFEEKKILGDIY